MTNQVVTQQGLRQGFGRANAELIKSYMLSGMNESDATAQASQAVLTRSYLRLEQLLTNNQTLFQFPILNNQTSGANAVRATEVRLNQQDSFFVTDMSVYLTLAPSATSTALVPKTYPSPTVFTTGAASLYSFYNGYVQIVINQSVIVPKFPLLDFLNIPQTQTTGAANPPADQFNPQMVSLWEPMVNFVGTKNTQVNIVLPGNITTIDALTYCIVEFHGVLAQNVTLMS